MRSLVCFFALCALGNKAFSWHESLSERASNPITTLSQLQTENDYSPKSYGSRDSYNQVLIKPLIALNRTESFPFEQVFRVKFQIPTLPNSSLTTRGTSLGDTQFFDLFTIEEPSWGRWGFGPMAIFPTATSSDAGQGKWQLGPAVGISVLKYPGWQLGFLAQNPISVAGNSKRSQQNYLLFQPFIIYHFLKNSYLITNSEWTIDWRHHVQQIPVNLGLGQTMKFIGKLHIDASLQLKVMAYQNAVSVDGFVPKYTIQFCLNFLFDD